MKNMKKATLTATAALLLSLLCSCADANEPAATNLALDSIETLAVITDPPSTSATALDKKTTVITTTVTTTEAATETTTAEPAEDFELSDTEVADKMLDYFTEKGYSVEQVSGIIGNAEVESGLEPSRGVSGGGFGLFQLMDCPQRRAMMAEFDKQGVGKYAGSEYWGFGSSRFDSEEDFDAFMEVLLDYTMNPEDPAWMEELHNATSPEEAAEVFLVFYERAVNGSSPIEYYGPYSGLYYQATAARREAARRWYDYYTAV